MGQFRIFHPSPILYTSSIPRILYLACWVVSYISFIPTWIRYRFVTRIFCLYNLPRAPTTALLLQCFSNLVRSSVNTLSTKWGLAFLRLAFINFFLKLFLFQSKVKYAVEDISQNFMSNNLNKKKSEYHFVKNLVCEHLTL